MRRNPQALPAQSALATLLAASLLAIPLHGLGHAESLLLVLTGVLGTACGVVVLADPARRAGLSGRSPGIVAAVALLALGALAVRPGASALGLFEIDALLVSTAAWLALAALAMHGLASKGTGVPFPLLLAFLVATASLWLQVAWDAGFGDLAFLRKGSPFSIIANTLDVWDAQPAARHRFLVYDTAARFEAGDVYHGFSPLYVAFFLPLVESVRSVMDVGTNRALQLLWPVHVFMVVGAFGWYLHRTGLALGPVASRWFASCGLVVGVIVVWPALPITHVYAPSTTLPLLLAGTFVLAAELRAGSNWRVVAAILGALALVIPLHASVLFLSVPFFAGDRDWREVGRILSIAGLFLAAGYLSPMVVAASAGLGFEGSSWGMRSGLDGDRNHFDSIWQAFAAPTRQRADYMRSYTAPWLALGVGVLGLLRLHLAETPATAAARAPVLLRDWLFLSSPYWVGLVLWPQSYSVHPHQYDYLLVTPSLAIAGCCLLSPAVQKRTSGPSAFVTLLVAMALVHFGLSRIAQAARACEEGNRVFCL